MNKEQYIRSRFRSLLFETLDERVKDIELNLGKNLKLNKSKEFDYVQEGKLCEGCGGMMKEGECSECGMKKGDVMEKKHGKLDKLSRFEIEDLLDDVKSDVKGKKHSNSEEDEEMEVEYELELDEETDYMEKEIKEKLYGKQHKLDKNKNGRLDKEDFKMLRKEDGEEQLYEVEFEKEVEDGETFDVKESYITEKWKGDVDVKQTGEYSDMSIEELNAAIKKQKAKNDKTQEMGKKVSHADKTKMSQLYFAKRAKQGWKGKGKAKVTESILFTESDLVDLIEILVVEEKEKIKKNISVKEPKGYKEYERAHKADKKENEDYLKSVAKKMTDYLKGASDEGSKYEMKETKKFPTENGGLKKGIRKKYTPSDAVDEYIDAFSYPGQTNLRFDEVKPNKKNIEKYLKGDSTTGNAQVDKDGNALGNVVPSEVGEKFFKNFEENLYGQEQADASYKRQSQPVDVAGEDTEEGSLSSKRPKGGKGKSAQSILNKLDESIEPKNIEKLNEEYNRIQELMGYNRKTQ